jgi:hypothetical protein
MNTVLDMVFDNSSIDEYMDLLNKSKYCPEELNVPEFVVPVNECYKSKITDDLKKAMARNGIKKLTVDRHDRLDSLPYMTFKNGEEIKIHKHPRGNYMDYRTYLQAERVIFNEPATIVFWEDGTKTIVKTMENDEYDPEVGFAMAFCKKTFGSDYKKIFKDIRSQYEKNISND